MKIAVTGATGFVGRHLIANLKGKCEIVAVSRSASNAAKCPWLDGIEHIEADILNPCDNIFEMLGKPNRLIHLAWGGLPNYKSVSHLKEGVLHYLFLERMIEGGLKDLTAIGTCFEYGMADGKLHENDRTAPQNPYGLAKDSLRKSLEFLCTDKKVLFRWVRLFYMYGEGQNENSLIPLLDTAIERGDKVFNMSGGEQLRDYMSVAEVGRNIAAIAMQDGITGVINCSSGSPISVRRLAEERIKQKSSDIVLNLGFYPYTDYEPMAFWGDNLKINKILELKS